MQVTDGIRILPRQARARAAVEAILEAAAQLLEAHGNHGFTTNAIADRAGVSIGTLYRTFANKEAVLLALARQETARVQQAIRTALTEPGDLAPDRAAIRAFLGAFAGRTTARRFALQALLARRQSPQPNTPDPGQPEPGAPGIEALMRDSDGQPLAPLRAFTLSRALLGAIRAAVMENPILLSQPAFEDELVHLARSIANGPATAARRATGRT